MFDLDQPGTIANGIFLTMFIPVIFPFFLKNRTRADKLLLGWFLFDVAVHIIFDSSWCFIQIMDGGPANSSFPLACIWNEYGKADSRWLFPDPEIMSIECAVMVVFLPLAVVNVFTTYFNSPSRHFYSVLLSSFEIFGTYMTFASEFLRGSPNLHYANPMHKWYYLAFTNGIWIWVPTLVLIHAASEIRKTFSAKQKTN